MRIPALGREAVLYARCRRLSVEFSIEIEPVGEGPNARAEDVGDPGLLRWKVGHGMDARVRARGITYLASSVSLLRALRDAHVFLRGLRDREGRGGWGWYEKREKQGEES